MQCLTKNKILDYNPDTLVAVRKLYNLDKPGQMDEAIDLLDAWVKKQNHFARKDYSREYLERVIILLKGSVERAKSQLDKICTLRTMLPHFFDKIDANNDFKSLLDYMSIVLLPKLTKDHNRIYMSKFNVSKAHSPKILFQTYTFNVLVCEYLKAHDYSDGIISIIDFRHVTIMDFISQINLVEMKQMCTISLEGYDCRAKKLLFISESKAIDMILKLCKQILSEKLGQRLFVVKTVEELHEHVDRDLLPLDYGGKEKPLKELFDEFVEVLGSDDNKTYLKEMRECRTNESMRIGTKSSFCEQFQDLDGTFRSLNVD